MVTIDGYERQSQHVTLRDPLNDGHWHHVVFTRTDSGDAKLYVDGELHTSGNDGGGNITTARPLNIGGEAIHERLHARSDLNAPRPRQAPSLDEERAGERLPVGREEARPEPGVGVLAGAGLQDHAACGATLRCAPHADAR